MAFHPEKIFGGGLLVSEGRREVILAVSNGNKIKSALIFDFDEARLIAEDILQCLKEGGGDA